MNKSKSNELTRYIKLKKLDAQSFLDFIRKKLKSQRIIDNKKKSITEKEFVLFPLIENKKLVKKIVENLKKKFKFEVTSRKHFIPNLNTSLSLKRILNEKLPQDVFNLIPKSFDIIGKIAIIEFSRFHDLDPEEREKYKKIFAESLIMVNNSIETIYEKKSKIKGKFRLRELNFLYGKNISETIHKENHCYFKLDVKKTYFSPRLNFERKRVSQYNVKENELILDMFAGVGPFSIQLAKNNRVIIYSFDVNPSAYYYLQENIKINNLKGRIFPYMLNVKELVKKTNKLGKKLQNKANRIIMNLPEKSMDYLDVACFLSNPSGALIHYYQFSERFNSINNTINNLALNLQKNNWRIDKVINSKVVKAYSPRLDLVVVDCKIKPKY